MALVVCSKCKSQFRFRIWKPTLIVAIALFSALGIYVGIHTGIAAGGDAYNGAPLFVVIAIFAAYWATSRFTRCPNCGRIQSI